MAFTRVLLAVALLAFAGCGSEKREAEPAETGSAGNPEAERAAVQSAGAWLELVDSESYGRSWEEASEHFRSLVTTDAWEQSVRAARGPLGAVLSRELKSKTYATTLPGAPDGEYVVIQYATSFENKQAAVETITPTRDSDGVWRVSGYYVR